MNRKKYFKESSRLYDNLVLLSEVAEEVNLLGSNYTFLGFVRWKDEN